MKRRDVLKLLAGSCLTPIVGCGEAEEYSLRPASAALVAYLKQNNPEILAALPSCSPSQMKDPPDLFEAGGVILARRELDAALKMASC